ncbi:MAG TPA: hypothetical protein VGJ30_08340 [Candidatus Angelobacter sp.]
MKITNPLHESGLIILDSSSPAFMVEVQKLLSPDAVTQASSFLSQSVVIVNNTTQFVWGFTVVYRYPDWISPAGTPWKHRISPSGGGAADRNRMLAPGARFLITPVSDFLASADANGNATVQPFLDEGMDRMIAHFKTQHPNPNEKIELTIDSIIFEDGLLEGPDAEGMMGKVNERIRAERDLGASLRTLKGDAFRAKLLFHSHKEISNEYSGRISNVAQSLLAVMNEHGEDAAQQILQQMRTRKWFVNNENVRRK